MKVKQKQMSGSMINEKNEMNLIDNEFKTELWLDKIGFDWTVLIDIVPTFSTSPFSYKRKKENDSINDNHDMIPITQLICNELNGNAKESWRNGLISNVPMNNVYKQFPLLSW